ncbi:OmpA family protein [Neolewinella agarilytica]|nr:OmpA family protein [Neolewinella agarilytica]
MRLLLFFLLLFPLLLCGQLKKADKLVGKGKYEKALPLYDELRNSTDSVERAAALFGYTKSFAKLNTTAEALPTILDLQQESSRFFRALSQEKRKTLSKTWRRSDRSLATQEKILCKRLIRDLGRCNVTSLFSEMLDLLSHRSWSPESKDLLNVAYGEREARLLNEELTAAVEGGLVGLRRWSEEQQGRYWGGSALRTIGALRERLVREIVNNPKATYDDLREVYNHHFQTESALNPRFQSLINGRLLEVFLSENPVSDFYRFVEENPVHWVAKDCYVDELAAILKNDDWHKLTNFLDDHPYSVLDEFVVGVVYEGMTQIRQLPGADQAALDRIKAEITVRRKVLNENDTSQETYLQLANLLQETVPATRCHAIFRRAAQVYLKQQEWELLDELVALGKQLFVNGQPDDCDRNWILYEDKQPWLADVEEILRQNAFPTRSAVVEEASVPEVDEYSPVITADDEHLFFARYRGGAATYDVVVSDRNKQGQWKKPRAIPALSSEKANEVPLAVTAAGNEMLLFLDGRLARSVRTGSKWSAPQPLTGSIANMDWHGAATLSPDGQFLILESNYNVGDQTERADTDLYLARRVAPGSFDVVTPLMKLNTDRRETSPYISPDGRTLYFSSDGRKGLGGTDVYVVRREDNTWRNWSTPQNFGKSVNSFFDDSDFRLATSASGRVGYYGINISNDLLSGDIFSAELPEEVRPEPFRIVKLPVSWSDSLSAAERDGFKVTVRSPDGSVLSGSAVVDGQVVLLLPESLDNAEITLTNAPDSETAILPVTLPVDLSEGRLLTPVVVNTLDNIRRHGERIRLVQPYNINQDDFTPTPETQQQLQDVYTLLRETGLNVTIHAYSDATGTPEYNRELCQRRADAVRAYLIAQGLAPERIQIKAHGSEDFIDTNDTEEGQGRNRRVELEVG